ncbi:hypothetical protein [Paractinoplanes durhamensis]|uniref:Uncharacterized protein n=1 Tax=Paractinoplanes durhamensis TaxID=113563 RepID=A0ABQ3YW95_9ACTN|nr:hypothetical protein [Actinoplanes durhamensis]GIE01861.1 hypothetical protein Adu01nite_32110 [Actinoplanes durhamensis]
MHHANHYYGHSHVLARYCGLDDTDPPRLHGYLQHGWNIGDGLAPDHEYTPGVPSFLWSERTRRRAWSLGRRQGYVVGAPFAYLLAMDPLSDSDQREGTIWYPFHGWEGQHVVGDHDALMAEIRRTEDGPVTVCLYWQEYRSAKLVRQYESAGFRVICHGYRGGWWKDLDPGFLYRQLAELRKHKRVASNRLCSAIFYGALAGCEPAVYGDPMHLENEKAAFGGHPRILREWASLHGPHPDPVAAARAAVDELGADRLLPPAELRRLLGWPMPSSVPDAELTGVLTR